MALSKLVSASLSKAKAPAERGKPAKGRGRPRTAPKPEPSGKQRGRPRTVKAAAPAGKRRGRPRKTDTPAVPVKTRSAKVTPAPEPQPKSAAAKPVTAIVAKHSVPTLSTADSRDLVPPVRDDGRVIERPTMKVLDKLFEKAHKDQNRERARTAVIMYNINKNGNFRELGFATAAEYWESRFGRSAGAVKVYVTGLKLLMDLGVSPDKVEAVFAQYNHTRLGQFAKFAYKSRRTIREIRDDVAMCRLDSNTSVKEFEATLKRKYQADALAADAEENEILADAEKPVKMPAYEVRKIDEATIRAAHDVSCREEHNPKLPIGVTIAKACGLYLGNHGTAFAELPALLSGIERGYGLRLLAIPSGEKSARLRGVPVVNAYEKDGRIILHTSKRDAARYFGVPVGDITEVQLDITPYLASIGHSPETQPVEDASIPKPVDAMDAKQLSNQISRLRKELGIPADTWAELAMELSLRDQLNLLVEKLAQKNKATTTKTHKIKAGQSVKRLVEEEEPVEEEEEPVEEEPVEEEPVEEEPAEEEPVEEELIEEEPAEEEPAEEDEEEESAD